MQPSEIFFLAGGMESTDDQRGANNEVLMVSRAARGPPVSGPAYSTKAGPHSASDVRLCYLHLLLVLVVGGERLLAVVRASAAWRAIPRHRQPGPVAPGVRFRSSGNGHAAIWR